MLEATQPSFKRGEQAAAAVRISKQAIDDQGVLPAATPALNVLVALAMRRGMPMISSLEPAPMVALMDSSGLTKYETPQPSPKES